MTSLPFIDLQDSPIFRMRAAELEASADSLRTRTKKLVSGAQRYTRALEDTFQESMRFADCIEAFCSGDDEESFAIGGPTIARFVQTLKELSSFVELLRTQVDLILCERLNQHSTALATELRAARKQLTQCSSEYDAARSRHLGHRSLAQRATPWANGKATTPERTHQAMNIARGASDDARYDLARKLVEVQGQYRFEFLECVASVFQAHLKYYEHGSAVVQTLAPYIDETLELADRLKGDASRRQDALEDLIKLEQVTSAASDTSSASALNSVSQQQQRKGISTNPSSGPLQMTAATTQLAWELEAFIRATAETDGSHVTVLKQGYLLKQSSKLKSKWQRRFFVLDSTGILYYYSAKGSDRTAASFIGGGGNAAGRDQHPHTTVNLLTATVKPGALPETVPPVPFAFRVVSPDREYVLQAEDEADAKSWMEVIQGVIACLLSGVIDIDISKPLTVSSRPTHTHTRTASMDMAGLSLGMSHAVAGQHRVGSGGDEALCRGFVAGQVPSPSSSDAHSSISGSPHRASATTARALSPLPTTTATSSAHAVQQVIGAVAGNAHCADCGAPGPDWGSLNLGTVHCIECSGFHRKLGVQVSKMRSLILDVRVWDAPVVALFQQLGNTAANAEWEAALECLSSIDRGSRFSPKTGEDWIWNEGSDGEEERRRGTSGDDAGCPSSGRMGIVEEAQRAAAALRLDRLPQKPNPSASAAEKEQFIVAKYQQLAFVSQGRENLETATCALWDAVNAGNLRQAYRALVCGADVGRHQTSSDAAKELVLGANALAATIGRTAATSPRDEREPTLAAILPTAANVTALHSACKGADSSLVELLLQWGAAVDAQDAFGRTPLMYCLLYDRPEVAKQLIRRGAACDVSDYNGRTAADLLTGLACTADADLLLLLGHGGAAVV